MSSKVEPSAERLFELATVAAIKSKDGVSKIFSQGEMLALGITHRMDALMPLLQQLSDARFVRFLHLDGKVHFALRDKDSAEKIHALSTDEAMIYDHVEGAGTLGIWTKAIKQRTGLVPAVITKSMKILEGKNLIKPIKNIKNPAQKVYILANLVPSEAVTGGPWHTEGELDLELIGVTADAIVRFIEQQSWVKGYAKRERERERSMSPIEALSAAGDARSTSPNASKKRKRVPQGGDIEGVHSKSKRVLGHHHGKIETQMSYPPGYSGYPTTAAVLHFITESGFIKTASALTEPDILALLDALVFDDRIEKINGGYRTIRGVSGASEAMKNLAAGRIGEFGDELEGNGLTQAPCGRCPVFDLCEEGGPVNARNCVYFETWLRV